MKEEFRILSTTAILGYGFPLESFEEGMKRKPDLIAVDAGSTDPGPFYLGEGVSFTDRGAVKRDLEIMICAGIKENIPVVFAEMPYETLRFLLNVCTANVIKVYAYLKYKYSTYCYYKCSNKFRFS